jgi:hypothetical protein
MKKNIFTLLFTLLSYLTYCQITDSVNCIPSSDLGYPQITLVNFADIHDTSAIITTGTSFYSFTGLVANVSQGQRVIMSVQSYDQPYIKVWIDFDHSETYSIDEEFLIGLDAAGGVATISSIITIPYTASLGLCRMRVRSAWYGYGLLGSCDYHYGTYTGETQDYYVNIMPSPPCTGTPNPGNTLTNGSTSVCGNDQFTLSVQNPILAPNMKYQWYSADNFAMTSNLIALDTFITQNITNQISPKYYQCAFNCSGSIGLSNPIYIANNPFQNCYCEVVGTNYFEITNVAIDSLNHSTISLPSPTAYSFYDSIIPNLVQGQTYPLSINTSSGSAKIITWIDFNHSGVFEDSEKYELGSGSSLITNVIVPNDAIIGLTRMRVRCAIWAGYYSGIGPCGLSNYGETEDYMVNVVSNHISILTPGSDALCSPFSVGSSITTSAPYAASGYANINTHSDTIKQNNLSATYQSGEPIGSCGSAGITNKTTWTKFVAPNCATPQIIISTDDRSTSNFDTRVSAYRRVSPTSCTGGYTEIACSDNDIHPSNVGATSNSTILLSPASSTPATNEYVLGETVYIQTSGVGSASGDYGLIVDIEPYVPITTTIGSGSAVLDWSAVSGMGAITGVWIQWRPVGSASTVAGIWRYVTGATNTTITGLTCQE